MINVIDKTIFCKKAMKIAYELKTSFIYQPGVSFLNSTIIIVRQ